MEFFRKVKGYVFGEVRCKLLHPIGEVYRCRNYIDIAKFIVSTMKDLTGTSRSRATPSSKVPGQEAQFSEKPARPAPPRKVAVQPILQSAGYGSSGGVQVWLGTSSPLLRKQPFDQYRRS